MTKKSLKILLYPVVIESCEEGGYFADCSVLQGCHAEGETYAEVIENIEEVIKAHIEIKKKSKEFVPSEVVEGRKNVSLNLPILVRA